MDDLDLHHECNELALLLSVAATRFHGQLERGEIADPADRQRTYDWVQKAIAAVKRVRPTGLE